MDKGKIVAIDTPKNLKNTIGTDVVTLDLEHGDCEAFRELPFVKEIIKHGSEVSLSLNNGEHQIPPLMEFAQSRRMKVRSVELHKPSLEDVFLRLTGTTIRERNISG
jgi:ABC-2 type transport system ATP-binding protein